MRAPREERVRVLRRERAAKDRVDLVLRDLRRAPGLPRLREMAVDARDGVGRAVGRGHGRLLAVVVPRHELQEARAVADRRLPVPPQAVQSRARDDAAELVRVLEEKRLAPFAAGGLHARDEVGVHAPAVVRAKEAADRVERRARPAADRVHLRRLRVPEVRHRVQRAVQEDGARQRRPPRGPGLGDARAPRLARLARLARHDALRVIAEEERLAVEAREVRRVEVAQHVFRRRDELFEHRPVSRPVRVAARVEADRQAEIGLHLLRRPEERVKLPLGAVAARPGVEREPVDAGAQRPRDLQLRVRERVRLEVLRQERPVDDAPAHRVVAVLAGLREPLGRRLRRVRTEGMRQRPVRRRPAPHEMREHLALRLRHGRGGRRPPRRLRRTRRAAMPPEGESSGQRGRQCKQDEQSLHDNLLDP